LRSRHGKAWSARARIARRRYQSAAYTKSAAGWLSHCVIVIASVIAIA
jgi:hypothetical protein